MKTTISLALLAVTLLLPWQNATAASFDCKKAKTWAEKTICNNKQLSNLDELLAASYKKALANTANKSSLKSDQLAWLGGRDACDDTECLKASYTTRIATLNEVVADETPQPRTLVGHISSYDCGDNCYLTVVDSHGEEHVGLCYATMCNAWNEAAAMPSRYLNRKVKIRVGTGKQYDGSGTHVMGEMDSFDHITLLN